MSETASHDGGFRQTLRVVVRPRLWPWSAWAALAVATAAILLSSTVLGYIRTDSPLDAAQALARGFSFGNAEPGVLELAVVVALGVFFTYRARLVYLRSRPVPPIDVPTFTDGTAPEERDRPVPIKGLTSLFRHELASLDETTVAPLPSTPAYTRASDFVEPLETSKSETIKMLAAVTRAVDTVWPRAAYKVTVLALERDEAPRRGLHVTVTNPVSRHPIGRFLPWEDSWVEVTLTAAHGTAHIIDERRHRGTVPTESACRAFDVQKRAANLAEERRYDEALAVYEDHRDDPDVADDLVNKMEMGSIQERLGLHLDSLLTYADVVEANDPSRDGSVRLSSPEIRHNLGNAPRPDIVVALWYRFAVRVGLYEKLLETWSKTTQESGSREELVELLWRRHGREFMRRKNWERQRWLALGDQSLSASVTEGDGTLWCDTVLGEGWRDRGTPWEDVAPAIGTFLLSCSLIELERLEALLDHAAPRRTRAGQDEEVTAMTVRHSIAWNHVRTWNLDPGPAVAISAVIEPLEAALDEREGEGYSGWSWHDHYLTACILALAIADETDLDADVDRWNRELEARVKRHLDLASNGGDPRLRDRLFNGDPDFDRLRERREFQTYLRTRFSASTVDVVSPPCVQEYRTAEYVNPLLRACAARMETIWRHHGEHAEQIPRGLLVECVERDLRVVKAVSEVADQAHDASERARRRARLLRAVEAARVDLVLDPVRVPYPTFILSKLFQPGDLTRQKRYTDKAKKTTEVLEGLRTETKATSDAEIGDIMGRLEAALRDPARDLDHQIPALREKYWFLVRVALERCGDVTTTDMQPSMDAIDRHRNHQLSLIPAQAVGAAPRPPFEDAAATRTDGPPDQGS